MLCEQIQRCVVHFVRDSKSSCGGHFAVGEQLELHAMFFDCLADFRRLIGRNAEDLKSIIAEQ